MRTITIRVLPEDVKNGLRSTPGRCPVALALRRAAGTDWLVMGAAAFCSDSAERVRLPARVIKWIVKFDGSATLPPAPAAFTLKLTKRFSYGHHIT